MRATDTASRQSPKLDPDLDNHSAETLLHALLQQALAYGARELHLQPGAEQLQLQWRIDGVLIDGPELPSAQQSLLRPWLLLQAGLTADPAPCNPLPPGSHLNPHQGQWSLTLDEQVLHLRLDRLPTQLGDRLRLSLIEQGEPPTLQQLGLDQATRDALHSLVCHGGLLLFAGPAGSGKSSLLYAVLRSLQQPGLNALTLEDPVAQRIPGLSQTDLDSLPGQGFADLLPLLLRQSPDLLLLSDLPDAASAQLTLRAALSGRTLLAGQYAANANGAVRQLLEFGISQSQLAEVLNGIVVLRLLRRLCEHCAEPVTEPDALETLFEAAVGAAPARRAVGCTQCQGTGYRGRLPLLEIHATDQAERHLLRQGRYLVECDRNPHQTLDSGATVAILDGLTSVAEVTRVLGAHYWQAVNAFACQEALRLARSNR